MVGPGAAMSSVELSQLAPALAAVLIALICAWCFNVWLAMVATRGKWLTSATSALERHDALLREQRAELDRLNDKVAAELSRRRTGGT